MELTKNKSDVTMADVASRAGVSQTTVSRVLSNHPCINSNTRDHVFKAIRELDYRHVSLKDGSLKNEKTTIGMFICPLPEQKDPLGLDFFSGIIAGVQATAAENQLDVVLMTLLPGVDNLSSIQLSTEKLSGMILLGYPSPALLRKLQHNRISYVIVSGDDSLDKFSNMITVNNVEGGMEAGRHLVTLGYRRIGMIMAKQNSLRISGLQVELMKHGLNIAPEDMHIVESTDISSFIEVIHHWIAAKNLPEAIVISFYDAAVTVKTMLTLNGIRVPEDIYLFTFKHRIGDTAVPGLRQAPAELMGRKATMRLLELLQYPDELPYKIVIPMVIESNS